MIDTFVLDLLTLYFERVIDLTSLRLTSNFNENHKEMKKKLFMMDKNER